MLALAAGALLVGCAGSGPAESATTEPSTGVHVAEPTGEWSGQEVPDPGQGEPAAAPTPGATVLPDPAGEPPVVAGWRLALWADPGWTEPVAEVAAWAEQQGAEVTVVAAVTDPESGFAQAVAGSPDLVVVLGAGAVDLTAFLSSQHLDQQFLVLGGQLAEPTSNVTSVIWPGATVRGAGVDRGIAPTPDTVDRQQLVRALAAGLSVVADGSDGYVVDLT